MYPLGIGNSNFGGSKMKKLFEIISGVALVLYLCIFYPIIPSSWYWARKNKTDKNSLRLLAHTFLGLLGIIGMVISFFVKGYYSIHLFSIYTYLPKSTVIVVLSAVLYTANGMNMMPFIIKLHKQVRSSKNSRILENYSR